MAKSSGNVATNVEMQLAKRKVMEKGHENVVAALDQLDGASATVSKATAVVKRRIEEMEELLAELEAKMHELVANHDREMGDMREKYTRETTALETRLKAAEEKLRKVQATLA